MGRKIVLELNVSDVHTPGAMSGYAAGYNQGKGADLQHAAIAIVRDPTGRVLTVTRPEPPHEYSIPGGMVEPGEQADRADARELKEECGVDCHALTHVVDITSPTDGRTVHVFRCDTWSGNAVALEPGSKIAWLMPGDLMRQAKKFRTSIQAIMNAGGLDMPRRPTRTSTDRKRRTMGEQKKTTAGNRVPRHRLTGPPVWARTAAAPAAVKAPSAAMRASGGGIALLNCVGLVTLDDESAPRVWNQLAEVGKFSGHPAGDFELSPAVFAQICANFARDRLPIPIDMEHASEQEPTDGTIPTHGAPAVGWIYQLENRGAAGLWGLVEWLEPARSYIKEGKYKFISPAIRFESRDRVTGQPIGARLTSAGITNQPFLRNMQPLVAKDGAKTRVYCMSTSMPENVEKGLEVVVHEPPAEEEPELEEEKELHASMAYGPAQYMSKVRACLKMPDLSTPKECSEKLEKLRDMHAESDGNKTADGVDLSSYLRSMRTLSGVGVGSTWENVFDVIEDMIEAAMDRDRIEDADAGPQLTDPKMPRPAHANALEAQEGKNMDNVKADPGVKQPGYGKGVPRKGDPRDGSKRDGKPHKNPPEMPRPDHAEEVEAEEGKTMNPNEDDTTMSDDNKLVVALRDANGLNGSLTLELKDIKHRLAVAEAENEHLKTLMRTQEEAALMHEVDVAFETYKDKKGLTLKDRPHMLNWARSNADGFRAMYPIVPTNQRHLLRDLTPPAPKVSPEALDASGQPLSFSQLTQKLMSDRKLSFDEAQNEAVRLQRSSTRAI